MAVFGLQDEFFEHTCTRCEKGGRNVEAKCYCRSCDQYFCTTCRDVHGEFASDNVLLGASENEGQHNQRMAEIQTRRIILVGKSGNGKSATGNTILGENSFEARGDFNAVTEKCEQYTKFQSRVRRNYTVVDTPGLFDTNQPFAKRALEIQRAIEICKDPHAFLIIVRLDVRFTEEEQLTIDMLRVIYGEKFLNHAILVFTRGSDFESDQDLNDALTKNETLNILKNECGGRVNRIDNNPRVDSIIREGLVGNILEMIEEVSDGGTKFYSYKSLDLHRNCLEQQLYSIHPNAKLGEQLKELVEQLGRQLGKDRWRSYLIGGFAGVGGATAAIGVAGIASAGKEPGVSGMEKEVMRGGFSLTTDNLARVVAYVYQGAMAAWRAYRW